MLGALLVFSWYSLNCDVTFKITIKFEIIIIKSHIIVGRTIEEQLAFPFYKFRYTN
jgi:hypothetical protein